MMPKHFMLSTGKGGGSSSGSGGGDAQTKAARNLTLVSICIAGLVTLALLFTVVHLFPTWSAITTSLLWAGACLVSGATVGFLFGIPKILQGDAVVATPPTVASPPTSPPSSPPSGSSGTGSGTPAPQYRQLVNTSLEQISEWLTKMIIGIGLTQLNTIWYNLDGTAGYIAKEIKNPTGGDERAFALALIIYFGVVGFLGGYLLTRLFLARAFSDVDQG